LSLSISEDVTHICWPVERHV